MFLLRNQNLSATMELTFQAPVAFDKDSLKNIATSALGAFSQFSLRPNQIWQRIGDALFDYELSFTMFNGQASFRIGPERALVNVQNARGRRDAEVMLQCLVSAAECFQTNPIQRTFLQAQCHGLFEPEADSEAFFASFTEPAQNVIDGGRIAFVQEKEWIAPVRISVERSIAFKNAAFIIWSADRTGKTNLEGLREIADTFDKASQKIGLKVEIE
jgi:hypothetical protein